MTASELAERSALALELNGRVRCRNAVLHGDGWRSVLGLESIMLLPSPSAQCWRSDPGGNIHRLTPRSSSELSWLVRLETRILLSRLLYTFGYTFIAIGIDAIAGFAAELVVDVSGT